MNGKVRGKVAQGLLNIVLIFFAFVSIYPMIFTLLTSFKDNEQFFKNFWGFPNPIIWTNYRDAFNTLLKYIGNSFFIAFVSIALIILISAMAGYAFCRLKFPGKEFFYVAIVALMMIPGLLQLIPRFALLKDFGMLDTYRGIILGYVAGGLTMGIMVIRASFESQPEELYEAARIDGSGEIRSFFKIALPLVKPTLGTVAIINLLNIWNDYLWPLIVTSDESKFTMALGLIKFKTSFGNTTLYGPTFAGYMVASLPLIILFLIFMDYFMEGLTAGAVKM
ncbi:MAG: carbohydrate ABC transporter permease [Oscillospiraceae bacterium]